MSIAVFLALVAPVALLPLTGARAGRFLADHLRPTRSVAVLSAALAGLAEAPHFAAPRATPRS